MRSSRGALLCNMYYVNGADWCGRFSHTLPPPFPTFVAPASETPETMPDELIGEAGPDTLGSEMDEE